MQRSEAMALVATLQAAFPAGNAGRGTVELYATELERYDAQHAAKAVRTLMDTRREPFLPTWAEIHDALITERPRLKALPEPDGVLPTPEQQAVIDQVMAAGEKRSSELQHGVRQRWLRDRAAELRGQESNGGAA